VENLSEVLKILDGALKANSSMATNYAGLLAEKLEQSGEQKQARMVRERLSRAKTAVAHVQDASKGISFSKPPVDSESRLDTLDISFPSLDTENVILPSAVQQRIQDFFDNVSHFEQLQKHGAALPNRVLLDGPPGTGKTLLARKIASDLKLPLYTVRCDTLVSSLLGQTSKNLRKAFDFATQRPCVLFLDEFDALAGARGNERDIGELQRVVIALIQNIDSLPNDAIVVAATNHNQLLDPAIWRRFSFRIPMPLPDEISRKKMWQHFIGELAPKNLKWDRLVYLSRGISGAVIEQVSLDTKRRCVIDGNSRISEHYLLKRLGLTIALLEGVSLPTYEKEIEWLREWNKKSFSLRTLAELYEISIRTVSNILKERDESPRVYRRFFGLSHATADSPC